MTEKKQIQKIDINRPKPLIEDKGLPPIQQSRQMPPVKPPKKK